MTNIGILIICIASFLIVCIICKTIIHIHDIDDWRLSRLDKVKTIFEAFDKAHGKVNGCSSDEHQLIINFKEQFRKLNL